MSVDTSILTALRNAKGSPVSGGDLSTKLGISRAAIWARIEDLRALGYEIDASPHEGYRLRHVPDVLHADDLASRLGKVKVIGRDIRVFKETTSTNDVIEKLARDGVKEGVAVFAESQTKGRGRLGRKWVSPAGRGVWCSILLRPAIAPPLATQITIASAVALARAIQSETGLKAEIKWPNDVLIAGRKVAGILTELSAELDMIKHLTVGIGVDVNLTAEDFSPELRKTATSLRIECGRPIDRGDFAAEMLRQLDNIYRAVTKGEFDQIADEWEHLCTTLGREVRIQMGQRLIIGRAESLDADGALLVRTQFGRLERITGGDVSLEKTP